MAYFKDIILKLRTEKRLSQEELAEKLSISKSTVGMWETGKRYPSKEMYELLADFFNVDMNYLYGRTEIRQNVHFDNDGTPYYYINEDTAKVAQEIFENKELSLLFDAARDAKPEDLKQVHDMLLFLKQKENNEG